MTVAIEKIKRHGGIAGQFAIDATVRYPDEEAQTISFVGSVYGGPVVMVTRDNQQQFVTAPERFGDFGEDWVRRFFAGIDDDGNDDEGGTDDASGS